MCFGRRSESVDLLGISILILNYKSGAYVSQCLESVGKQMFPEWGLSFVILGLLMILSIN